MFASISALLLIFTFCETPTVAFSMTADIPHIKGDPMLEHEDYYALLYNEFSRIENLTHNHAFPSVWEKKPDFWLWDNDYRVVRVYNMPHMCDRNVPDNFFTASKSILKQAREVAQFDEKIAKLVGKAFSEAFHKELRNKLKGSSEIKALAYFLGTDEETAFDSFFMGVGMTLVSQVSHGVAIFGAILEAFGVSSFPWGLIFDVMSFFSTRSALSKERCLNYAMVMHSAYNMLLTSPERILESNVFVSAVDERDFTAFLRWNAFRRNDGAWCAFRLYPELKCAPKGRDSCTKKEIMRLSKEFKEILDWKQGKMQNFTMFEGIPEIISS